MFPLHAVHTLSRRGRKINYAAAAATVGKSIFEKERVTQSSARTCGSVLLITPVEVLHRNEAAGSGQLINVTTQKSPQSAKVTVAPNKRAKDSANINECPKRIGSQKNLMQLFSVCVCNKTELGFYNNNINDDGDRLPLRLP